MPSKEGRVFNFNGKGGGGGGVGGKKKKRWPTLFYAPTREKEWLNETPIINLNSHGGEEKGEGGGDGHTTKGRRR